MRAPSVTTKCNPVFLKQLVEHCGGNAAEAGRKIGASGEMVSRALRDNVVTKVYEMAAMGIVNSMTRTGKQSLFIIRVPTNSDHAKLLLAFINGIGIKAATFSDD